MAESEKSGSVNKTRLLEAVFKKLHGFHHPGVLMWAFRWNLRFLLSLIVSSISTMKIYSCILGKEEIKMNRKKERVCVRTFPV